MVGLDDVYVLVTERAGVLTAFDVEVVASPTPRAVPQHTLCTPVARGGPACVLRYTPRAFTFAPS